MKLNLLRTALVLFILVTASGAQAESSVWAANSSKATVYLAGSFHMLRESDYPLPAEFFTAYQDSHKIIFEVPPGEMEKLENAEKFLSAAIYSDGTTLKEHITSEAYAKAESFCNEQNYPIAQYRLFKPTFFVMTLTILEMNKIGADPQKGVDYFFKQKALSDGKATGSLETMEEQIRLLASIDANVGSDQILEAIDELKQVDAKLSEIIAAWRKGDEIKMEALYIQGLKSYPKLYQTLIVSRNNKWVKDIEGFLNTSGNTMVVVGAAHLAGADGLVNLLRKRGYKVVKLNK
jgi:uncharacterized protein YbaP (TraB family)